MWAFTLSLFGVITILAGFLYAFIFVQQNYNIHHEMLQDNPIVMHLMYLIYKITTEFAEVIKGVYASIFTLEKDYPNKYLECTKKRSYSFQLFLLIFHNNKEITLYFIAHYQYNIVKNAFIQKTTTLGLSHFFGFQ